MKRTRSVRLLSKKDDLESVIRENCGVLLRSINPSEQFLIQLSFSHSWLQDKMKDVKGERTPRDRNAKLLEILSSVPNEHLKSVFRLFLSVLRDDDQDHVANVFQKESDAIPMSDPHYQTLTKKSGELRRFMNPTSDLIDSFIDNDVFNSRDKDCVRYKETVDEKTQAIVDIISRKSDEVFDKFVNALNRSGQGHVAFILTGQGQPPMSEEHRRHLIDKRDQLKQFIVVDGLIDKLRMAKVFDDYDEQTVLGKPTINERSCEVVNLLMRKDDLAFDTFIDALNETGQGHVAYILTQTGDPPLSHECIDRLRTKREKLIENIESKHSLLLDKLISANVLNDSEKQQIEAKQTNHHMNRALLDIMARKSQKSYDKFIELLKSDQQNHLWLELRGLETTVRVEVEFADGTSPLQRQNVVDALPREIDERKGSELNNVALLQQNGLSVVRAEKGSVIVVFKCLGYDSLLNLRQLRESGEMDRLFTETFCPLFSTLGLLRLRVVITESEFQRCEQTFNELKLMTAEHRQAIRAARKQLLDKIVVNNDLLSRLSFCEKRRMAVQLAGTKKQQAKTLLQVVSRQPDSKFTTLIRALADVGQTEVSSFLQTAALQSVCTQKDSDVPLRYQSESALKKISSIEHAKAATELFLVENTSMGESFEIMDIIYKDLGVSSQAGDSNVADSFESFHRQTQQVVDMSDIWSSHMQQPVHDMQYRHDNIDTMHVMPQSDSQAGLQRLDSYPTPHLNFDQRQPDSQMKYDCQVPQQQTDLLSPFRDDTAFTSPLQPPPPTHLQSNLQETSSPFFGPQMADTWFQSSSVSDSFRNIVQPGMTQQHPLHRELRSNTSGLPFSPMYQVPHTNELQDTFSDYSSFTTMGSQQQVPMDTGPKPSPKGPVSWSETPHQSYYIPSTQQHQNIPGMVTTSGAETPTQKHTLDAMQHFEIPVKISRTEPPDYVTPGSHVPTEITHLPREVTEIILMKAIITRRRKKGTRFLRTRRDYTLRLISIISVCHDWFSIVTSRRYNRTRLQQYVNIQVMKPYSKDLKNIIKVNADQLVEIIEPDYGLLDELVKVKLISPGQQQTIQKQTTSSERNRQLLTHLSKLNDKQCIELSAALRATNQQHVVNVLCLSSGFDDKKLSSTFGDVRPLTSHQRVIIGTNYSSLIELIEFTDDHLELLQTNGCITSQQRQCIDSDQSVTDKNKRLLNILMRRSVRDYKRFVDCLVKVGQQNIATAMSSSAVILSMTINVDLSQGQTAWTWNIDLVGKLSCVGEQFGSDVVLISIAQSKDIKSHFLCKSANGLHRLDGLYIAGQLKPILQEVFNGLLSTGCPPIAINDVVCEPNDFIQRLLFFYPTVCKEWRCSNMNTLVHIVEPDYGLLDELVSAELLSHEKCNNIMSKTSVEKRNKQLLEYLKDKDCQQLFVCFRKTNQQHVVNFCCRQSGDYKSELTDAFGGVLPMTAEELDFITFNFSVLIEITLPNNGLLDKLLTAGCVTQRQKETIEVSRDVAKQNELLRDILKKRSLRDFDQFTECLLATGQPLLAAAAAQGGVIAPLDVKLVGVNNDDDVTRTAAGIIVNNFKVRSLTDSPMCLTETLGPDVALVSLMNTADTHGIRSYFHCKTVMGLHHLDELCNTGRLATSLRQLFVELTDVCTPITLSDIVWKSNVYIRGVRHFHRQLDLCSQVYQLCPYEETEMNTGFSASEQLLSDGILEIVIIKSVDLLLKVFYKSCIRSDIIIWMIPAAVCRSWWNIIRTRRMKSRLDRRIDAVCRPWRRHPQLVHQLDTKSSGVEGLTQMDDKLFVVCSWSDTIRVFGLNYEQLEDIEVKGLEQPWDIVACSETRSLYVADWWSPGCVWRVSTDGQVDKFTTTSSNPRSLSVTSGRLLVTAGDVLLLFGADGVELKRLSFTDMSNLLHAVETPRGTFVFCHHKPQPQVVEVDGDGRIISVFNNQQQLTWPWHLSIDSEGQMFIADQSKHHILLLTSDLQLDRVLLDAEHNQLVECPHRLFYVQQTRQLVIGHHWSPAVVQVFAVG